MKNPVILTVGLAVACSLLNARERRVLVVNAFTLAPGVSTPYDMKQLHDATVVDLKSLLAKEFDVVAEAPAGSDGRVWTLDVKMTGWRPGNAMKRMTIGLGSGRESAAQKHDGGQLAHCLFQE